MILRLRTFLLFSLCIVSCSLHAQKDTEFWFAVPEIAQSQGNTPIRFRFSAFDQDATVRIEVPANSSFIPQTVEVPANTVKSLDLTYAINALENFPPDQILSKGVLITSTTPITTYYEVASTNSPDIFPLKGRNALGTLFFVPSQFTFRNVSGNNAVDIVATRNRTTISITPSQDIVGHVADSSFTLILNRGETYSLAATSTDGSGHLRGTKVVSDKAISLTSSNNAVLVDAGSGWGWDLIGDQLIPVALLGTEYIAIRGALNAEGVYVTATEDGTTVSLAGGQPASASLNEGESALFEFSGDAMYLTANKPIYVLQLTGKEAEAGSAILPPIICRGSEEVAFIKGTGTNILYLQTTDGNQDFFELNGDSALINASSFFPVPGSNGQYVAANIDATAILNFNVTNLLRNTKGPFHLGILHTFGPGSSFGYFSQYSSLYLGEELTICAGETGILDGGENKDNYRWNDGSTGRFLEVTEAGKYWVTVEYYNCSLTNTVEVFVIDAPVDLGEDTTLCIGETLTLDAEHPFATYEWQDGSQDARFLIREEGLYSISRDVDGCTYTDSIHVSFVEPPRVELGEDTTLCRGAFLQLDVYKSGMSYTWQDGSTDSIYQIESPGLYWVEVNDDGCIGRDSIYNNSIFGEIELGGDTLLCENEILSFDASFPNTDYLWGDGSNTPIRSFNQPGEYTLRMSNACQTVYDTLRVRYSDCRCVMSVPTAFSPNDDGINEQFGVIYDCMLEGFNLRIYNRWGKEVFATNNPDIQWDGRYKGRFAQEGVYVWVITYYGNRNRRPISMQEKGTVTLIR